MVKIHMIGDPHLGRKFGVEQGVQLHRLGERELGQMLQFSAELEVDCDYNVMIGDLFDHPYVSDAVIVAAARAMLGAAERNPETTYVAIAGNHDKPRNLALVGAWHAFREMAQDRLDNLIILDRPAVVGPMALFPWEWDRRADDQVRDVESHVGVTHAIGHWDLAMFDGKDDHLVPIARLREAFGDNVEMWSGHYHVAGVYLDVVNCTGSMQGYAHGESDQYVTLTREEALLRTDLHDKHVRVLLAPGEDLPELDCIAITHKRLATEDEPEAVVSADDFDFLGLIKGRIKDRDPQVRGFIEERMGCAAEEQR